jgi:hypothetical protein
MDHLAILTKLKAEVKEKNQRRYDVVTFLKILTTNISIQHDISTGLKREGEGHRRLLSKEIEERVNKAADLAGVKSSFRETFIRHVTEGLKREVEHELSSTRFALIDSDNKILTWQQEQSDLQEELRILDRELIKLNRKLHNAKQAVIASLEKLQEKLCLSR